MPEPKSRPRYKIIVPPLQVPRAAVNSSWVGPIWGLGGFVLGIALWHALGFWDFVGKTVLKGDEEERRLARVEQLPELPSLRTTASVHGPKQIVAGYSASAAKALRACSIAIQSAEGDETGIIPCPVGTTPAPTGKLARRADFGAIPEPEPKGWGFTVRLP